MTTPPSDEMVNGLTEEETAATASCAGLVSVAPPGERERFEAFYGPRWGRAYLEWSDSAGRYAWDATQEAWDVWQAALTTREALTEKEIQAEFDRRWEDAYSEVAVFDLPDFRHGIRFAEKHHGIKGASDE